MTSLDGKIFCSLSNGELGDVDSNTLFYYHQKDHYIWGHYEGPSIRSGVLLGILLSEDQFQMRYMHFDTDGNLKEGKCLTQICLDQQNRIQLIENWEWTAGSKGKGRSILIEKN